MWIFFNDAFFSIVEDEHNPLRFSVRARAKGDLEKVFHVSSKAVIENPLKDYRFRVFLPKDVVIRRLGAEMETINYTNFKDSIPDVEVKTGRYNAYLKVWTVLFNWQEGRYPPQKKDKWWKNYKYQNDKSIYDDDDILV